MIYARNKETGEHILWPERGTLQRTKVLYSGDWEPVEADADGWINHGMRKHCPLPKGFCCDFKNRAGYQHNGKLAENLMWDCISLYRPILTHPDQSKEWRGPEVGEEVRHPTGQGVVMLPPDTQGVTIIKSTNNDEYCGEYKCVAASACTPIKTDRERWIEVAEFTIEDSTGEPASSTHLGLLFDAGLARLPEE